MGMGEEDLFLGSEERLGQWSKPQKIQVPRRADGKLGFNIIVKEHHGGNITKVTQVKETCLSSELTESLYITKIDETDICHLKTSVEVEDVLTRSSGTVVVLETCQLQNLGSTGDMQRMSLNSSVSSCSSSTNSMSSLLLEAESSHYSSSSQLVPTQYPDYMEMAYNGISLQEALFQNPEGIQWDDKTKKVILKKSIDGSFGFDYKVYPPTSKGQTHSGSSSENCYMFFLVISVKGDAVGKLKVGDLILSLNRIACQDLSVDRDIKEEIVKMSEICLIVQRPMKFNHQLLNKHRNNPNLKQKMVCPTQRVFMCGSGAMLYYNFLLANHISSLPNIAPVYQTNQNLNNSNPAAFKACCVWWTKEGLFSIGPWNMRSQFYLEKSRQLVALELLAVSDESFFHHCMNLSFTKNSIFLIMLDCQQSTTTPVTKQIIQRYIHTIHSCIGEDIQIKVKCVCQHSDGQCHSKQNYHDEELIIIPSNSNNRHTDKFFNSLFELALKKQSMMPSTVAYVLYKLYSLGTYRNVVPDYDKAIERIFEKISKTDLRQIIIEMESFRHYIGVNSRLGPCSSPSSQGNCVYLNIEYLLNCMSELTYKTMPSSNKTQDLTRNRESSFGLVHRKILEQNLYPCDMNTSAVLALLESNKVIFGLKRTGHHSCTNYYVPCLQPSVQMEVPCVLNSPHSMYIQFRKHVQHTDFLKLVVYFGNRHGWDLFTEVQLSQCPLLIDKRMFTFQFRWALKQIKITPGVASDSTREIDSLIQFRNQLHYVCGEVFPQTFLMFHNGCRSQQCIYCCQPAIRNQLSPIYCTKLVNEELFEPAPAQNKVVNIERLPILKMDYNIFQTICRQINDSPLNNWRKLAGLLKFNQRQVTSYETSQNPCEDVLNDWHNTDLNATVGSLRDILRVMNRLDLVGILDRYILNT